MKILVTGGAGFIGSNFLGALVPRHPSCLFVCLDRLTYAGHPASLDPIRQAQNFVFEQGDVAEGDAVRGIFARYQPDFVVHFAAETHVDRSIVEPTEFVRTNVMGTLNLLLAARTQGVRRFHHVSTDEVYGSLADDAPAFHEGSPYDPSSPYAASKAAADHLVRSFHRTHGLPITITHASNNYGPRQMPDKLVPLAMTHALDGRPIPVYGQGRNRRDWLYVDDHCAAIWAVLLRGIPGETYDVGGNEERTNLDLVREVCRLVARETGRPPESVESLITFVSDRPGHDHRYAVDTTRIRRDLGWAPRETLRSALRSTLRWYLANPGWLDAVRGSDHRAWLQTNYAHRLELVDEAVADEADTADAVAEEATAQ
jgi:dTDP-glucose 4,6-dehydratase